VVPTTTRDSLPATATTVVTCAVWRDRSRQSIASPFEGDQAKTWRLVFLFPRARAGDKSKEIFRVVNKL
jgi:hypothetical protein